MSKQRYKGDVSLLLAKSLHFAHTKLLNSAVQHVQLKSPNRNILSVISLHVRPASLTHHFVPGCMILGNVRPYGRMVLRGDACFQIMCVPCQGSLDSYCSLLSAQQSASKRCSVCENRVSLVLHISGAHL